MPKGKGAAIPPELPNMPMGNIPGEVRDIAEFVVKLESDVEQMAEDLRREKDKLLTLMVRNKVTVVPVIVAGFKTRISIKRKEGVELKIKKEGIADEKKGEAEKNGKERANV